MAGALLPSDSRRTSSSDRPDATLAESEPALAESAAASTLGVAPAGPALRQRDPITLRGRAELLHTKAPCASLGGFSLHASTRDVQREEEKQAAHARAGGPDRNWLRAPSTAAHDDDFSGRDRPP